MGVQYKTDVDWDPNLIDLEFTDIDNPVVKGLVEKAILIVTGAPTATAGKFIPGAEVVNAVDGTSYRNIGSTASPSFALIETGVPAPFFTKFAGTASGGTTATRAYTITGALASDIASAVIRASTNAASIQKATVSTNTLTVLFSTDPGAGTTVDYTLTRAS